MTKNIKSADDLIVQTENQKLGRKQPEQPKEQKTPQIEQLPESDSGKESKVVDEQASDQKESEPKGEALEGKQESQEKAQGEGTKVESSDDETDDYGNKIDKPKLYTEEQVQKMIRDRLARGKNQQTFEQNKKIEETAKDFKADPESGEDWEHQLESFIEKTLTKVSQKSQQEEWQRKERETQEQFEDKFTNGMSKYGDFNEVVGGKPVTNSMMMATRSMQDPAAFLYAACKQHPAEIERIAQIPDAVTQIAEIGRLEERMKKAKTITKAPNPLKKVTGDMSDDMPKRSVDQLIREHAKSKIMNRR